MTAVGGPGPAGRPDAVVVSVVIPTYRGGAYLRESVNSVLAQSLTEIELIVVADGAPDDLTDVAALDPRVHVLRQPNRGRSVARNVGVRAARAELIAFLDDDDRMLPGRLEAQAAALTAQPRAGLCHTQYRMIDADGVPGAPGHAADVQYDDLLRGHIHVVMPTTMMRRSVLEEVGLFDPARATGEDLDVIYRVARESDLVFLPAVLTEYRRHDGNVSSDPVAGARDVTTLLRKLRRFEHQRGRAGAAAAAGEGLRWAARYGAHGAIDQARSAWRERHLAGVAQGLGRAVRLAPAETAGDLIGHRLPAPLAHRLPAPLGRRTTAPSLTPGGFR